MGIADFNNILPAHIRTAVIGSEGHFLFILPVSPQNPSVPVILLVIAHICLLLKILSVVLKTNNQSNANLDSCIAGTELFVNVNVGVNDSVVYAARLCLPVDVGHQLQRIDDGRHDTRDARELLPVVQCACQEL